MKIKLSFPRRASFSTNVVASNDDLLVKILLRLPIKPLVKFKCVSKHWLSFISNPNFSRRHPLSNHPVSSGLFLHRSSFLINLDFDFVPFDNNENNTIRAPFRSLTSVNDPASTRILQSCNGLLLCCSFRAHEPKRDCYIYNPTTRQHTVLLRLHFRDGAAYSNVCGLALAFDPSRSQDLYKVICVRRCNDFSRNDQYQIEIYSSDQSQTGPFWSLSAGNPFTAPEDAIFRYGVYWNRAIHWLEASLYFDVDHERVQKMPLPHLPHLHLGPNYRDGRRVRYFGESRGHLHLVESFGPRYEELHMYEMERDYSKWSVKNFCVDIDQVIVAFPEMVQTYLDPSDFHYYALPILCLVSAGEYDKDTFLILHVPGKAIRYNLNDKSFKKLSDFSPNYPYVDQGFDLGSDLGRYLQFQQWDASQFIESMSSV